MPNSLNVAMAKLDIPTRMMRLPIDERGFPVPKFVQWIDGKPDFRVMDRWFMVRAVRNRLCWLCGERMGRHLAFVIGPMCAVNRVNSEPPSHLECARFAVKACPFMTQPKRPRNEHDMPANAMPAPGISIARNPGAMLIWVTDTYRPFDAGNGALFKLGEPTKLEWYARGREATREEILASINSGLPILRKVAEQDGPESLAAFERQAKEAMTLIPEERKDDPDGRNVLEAGA